MALPTLNVLALRNRARRDAGVSSDDYSNADLLEDFNQAYGELAVLLANLGEDYFEEQNVKFNLVANSGLYSMPADSIAIKQIRLAYSGTPLAPSAYRIATSYDPANVHDIASQEENIPASNPIVDYTGNFFRIKPKPTVSVSNGGRIDYIAMPSALVNTGDTPVFPISYQKKIATYGAMKMAFKFEKWNKHARLQKEWDQTMAELQDRLADRDMNAPLRFRGPHEGGARNTVVREL